MICKKIMEGVRTWLSCLKLEKIGDQALGDFIFFLEASRRPYVNMLGPFVRRSPSDTRTRTRWLLSASLPR